MQVKFTRSKFEKGMLSKRTWFKVDAMLMLSPEERTLFEKYDFLETSVLTMATQGQPDDSLLDLVSATFRRLIDGVSFEKENLHDILTLEEGILAGCKAVMRYCKRAESFNGDARVFEIEDGEAKLVA